MKTINCTDWEMVTKEGIDQNEPPRKRKRHIRKYSIIYCLGSLVKGLILAAAFLTIMAAVGNTIELLARL